MVIKHIRLNTIYRIKCPHTSLNERKKKQLNGNHSISACNFHYKTIVDEKKRERETTRKKAANIL